VFMLSLVRVPDSLCVRACVCAFVFVCVRGCARACVRACVRACFLLCASWTSCVLRPRVFSHTVWQGRGHHL
jgi:hypothetical protein